MLFRSVITVQDHTITLNEVTIEGDRLQANFTIENKHDTDDLAISSLMDFSARNADGTNLDHAMLDCNPDMGGKVLPGDLLRGNVCWTGATSDTVKIYYEASLFGEGAVVWEITK